nr:ribonuclease H-like domain, Gag-pre-integrase domain protein [Tanacetum cinerariifolium]
MSVRTKVGLGFTNCIRENELGWDDSVFSVFTTNSEDVEGRPIFHRFAKTDSMKVVPPPLSRDYTSLSDHIDLDEPQMSYGTKSSTSYDSKSVSNDFVSCDDSDKSSEAGHFRKNASSVSKLCFVCGSGTHLIKDCDFYEKQMANKTVRTRVGPVHSRNKVTPVSTGKPKVTPVSTGKPNVTPVPTGKPKVTPVPTGKPKVTPVPTGRPNRSFLVSTDRGFSPSVISSWWSKIYGQLMLSPQQVVLGNHIEKVYTGYSRTIVDLIHLHTDDNVADLLTKAFDRPRVFNSPMLHLLRVEMVINSPWIMPILGTKELAIPEQTAPVPTGRYVVPTCRVIVPTGRYVVPTGRVMVATGRYVVSAGSKDLSRVGSNMVHKLTAVVRIFLSLGGR